MINFKSDVEILFVNEKNIYFMILLYDYFVSFICQNSKKLSKKLIAFFDINIC